MRFTALALLVLVAACTQDRSAKSPVADPASRRSLPAGDVVGFVGPFGSYEYRGIPYARAPVANRRWRAPETLPRWEGTYEALEFGAACPQYGSRFAGVPVPSDQIAGEEDCLFLNVYAPRDPGAGKRPVLVWIHGGGNVIGQASNYDGGHLAAERDVVMVAINYRLGPLGWFRHASLREDAASAGDRSGNYGVLDMVAALTWVRDNVASFGGDPDNVTIFGESAGGRDVFALLQAPAARGLFHRAISQSGALRSSSLAEAENFVDDPEAGLPNSSSEIVLRLLIADGAPDRAAARKKLDGMTPGDVGSYLRGKSAPDLLSVYSTDEMEGLIEVPQMFPDGAVLPEGTALQALATPGGHAGVPVMIGTNRDEDKLFLFASPEHTQEVFWVLPRLRDPERFEALAEHGSRMWKASGADEPAAALREGGGPGVYVYRFDWDEEPTVLGADFGQMVGAAHGFEIPFVFGVFDLGDEADFVWADETEASRRTLSDQMTSYWVNFAATGKPGRGIDGNLPEWGQAPSFMVLDTAAGGGLRMSDETLREEDVYEAALADTRLGTPEQRCEALRQLRGRTNRHREAALPAGCS